MCIRDSMNSIPSKRLPPPGLSIMAFAFSEVMVTAFLDGILNILISLFLFCYPRPLGFEEGATLLIISRKLYLIVINLPTLRLDNVTDYLKQ